MSVKKRLLRIFAILLLLGVFVGYFTFSTLLFKPFEADYEFDVAALIPARVDFFVAKARLEDTFDGFPRLAVMDELEGHEGWEILRDSPEFNDRLASSGLDREFFQRIEDEISRIPLGMEPQDIFGGRDLAIAGNFKGRNLAQADWALYGRVNWVGKLAFALLSYPGLIGIEQSGLSVSSQDGVVQLSGGQLRRPLHLTRIRDVVIIGTSPALLEAAHTLAQASGEDSIYGSAAYNDYIRRAPRAGDDREFEVFVDVRALLANLQLSGPWPDTESQRFAPAFLGRLVQAPSCKRIVGVAGLNQGLDLDLFGSFSSELITPEQARIYRSPGFDHDQILRVAHFAPEDVALFAYLQGPVADILRLMFASVEPALRQNLEEAFRSTGRYESLDQLIDEFAGSVHNRLAFFLRENDYPPEPDGPAHDDTPVFAMTLVTWVQDEAQLDRIRDTIGHNPDKFGLQGRNAGETGYWSLFVGGIDTREFWSPFVPGTGIISTMSTEKHCYITNQNLMLRHVHETYTGQPGRSSLSDRPDFQSLVYSSLPSANLMVWVNPGEASTTLHQQAEYSAATEVEFSIPWTTQRAKEEATALQDIFPGRAMNQLDDLQKTRINNLVDSRLDLFGDRFRSEQIPLVKAAKERQIAYLESISSLLMMLRLEQKQFRLSLRVRVPLDQSP